MNIWQYLYLAPDPGSEVRLPPEEDIEGHVPEGVADPSGQQKPLLGASPDRQLRQWPLEESTEPQKGFWVTQEPELLTIWP